jgi:hypothetical protein
VYSQYFGNAYFSKPSAPKPLEIPQTAPSAAIVPSQPAETLQPQLLTMPLASSVFVAPSSAVATGNRSEGGAGVTFTSVSDFKEWLSREPKNTASTPYNAKLNVKSLTGIMTVLKDAPLKHINRDFSGSTFTSIEDSAFEDCKSLASVLMPDSVTSIGDDAFKGCANLASVTIGSGVKSILNNAFSECTSLESVTFNGKIPSIGFSSLVVFPVFPGDLRAKFYATDKTNGTPGTYTRKSGSSTWTRQ